MNGQAEGQHWAVGILTEWLLEEVQRRVGTGERARSEAVGLWNVLEPIRGGPLRPRLREIAAELKRSDGEHWAVGEMLERACIFLDAFYATLPPQKQPEGACEPSEVQA